MKKLLVSGFEPFADLKINPSQELVQRLEKKKIAGFQIESIILPVSFENSFALLEKKILNCNPDVVIAFGLAINREKICLERIAINCKSSDIADNDGVQPAEEKIDLQGEDGMFSLVPISNLQKYADEKRWPVEISNTAGTYVCNYLFYRLLQLSKKKNIRAGFIHIPPTPEVAHHLMDATKGVEISDMEEIISELLLMALQ